MQKMTSAYANKMLRNLEEGFRSRTTSKQYTCVYLFMEMLLFKVNAYELSVIGYMFLFMVIINKGCLTNNLLI